MAENMKPVISLRGIKKVFNQGKENELEILHGIDLDIYPGELLAIIGQSGSGKSTLMNIMGALDKPTEGTYYLNDINMLEADDSKLSQLRNKYIGFVFQTFNLISRMNVFKNVELPLIYAGVDANTRKKIVLEKLEKVEMSDRAYHNPNELSGGQKQRAAIARSLVNKPAIIFADEPTGALDSKTSRTVMDLFHRLHKEDKCTIVIITHNPELAEECERVVTIADGMIVSTRKGNNQK